MSPAFRVPDYAGAKPLLALAVATPAHDAAGRKIRKILRLCVPGNLQCDQRRPQPDGCRKLCDFSEGVSTCHNHSITDKRQPKFRFAPDLVCPVAVFLEASLDFWRRPCSGSQRQRVAAAARRGGQPQFARTDCHWRVFAPALKRLVSDRLGIHLDIC